MGPTTLLPLYQGNAVDEFLKSHLQAVAWHRDDRELLHCQEAVEDLILQVVRRGDTALYELAERFGDSLQEGQSIAFSTAEWDEAVAEVPQHLVEVITQAAQTIEAFAKLQLAPIQQQPLPVLEKKGYQASYRWQPVDRVACYVPGGRYPLVSSALMTGISARVAGVRHIVMACPNPTSEVLLAARLAGVHTFYRMGGAQAVAALAFGTQSVDKVDMVVGPGNRYVNEAKRQLLGWIGIDMLAGPSEVVLIADEQAKPDWVAADLLSQAEHDPMARAILLTPSSALAQAVQPALAHQLQLLNLPHYVKHESLANSAVLVLPTLQDCAAVSNQLAPEHLHLHGAEVEALLPQLQHYGTVFVGDHATVPHGDYAAGPNHTLPTGRSARFSGALSPYTFLRMQNQVTVHQPNAYLTDITAAMARLEGLVAHAHAATIREPAPRND